MLSEEQMQDLSAIRYINRIDDKVTIIAEVEACDNPRVPTDDEWVTLFLQVFYEGQKMARLSYNLINYNYDEIIYTAKNIKENAYILREVDNYLAGDIE